MRMRPLSQVDPWNGCKVCRRQAELGIMPHHNWTHELRMWWNDKVPAWTYGTDPKHEHEPPESRAVGVSGATLGLVGIALSPLADKARKEGTVERTDPQPEDGIRLGSLASYYYAGRLAALLAEKYRPFTVKETAVAR